ncbi:hypothetical protein quinque_000374 [Culex quinquefasciatus]
MDQWPPLVQQDKRCLAMRAFTPATGDKLQIKRGGHDYDLVHGPGQGVVDGLVKRENRNISEKPCAAGWSQKQNNNNLRLAKHITFVHSHGKLPVIPPELSENIVNGVLNTSDKIFALMRKLVGAIKTVKISDVMKRCTTKGYKLASRIRVRLHRGQHMAFEMFRFSRSNKPVHHPCPGPWTRS